ncbi:MAG TPA: hypothetical protein ENJ18_11450 [Nannocystis exedens]|nr:hypothetical protein [Nannocystis exedens]
MRGAEHFEERFFRITVDHDARVYVLQRTSVVYSTVEELEQAMVELAGVMDRVGRDGWTMIMDLRSVKGRNDEPFETAMRRLRPLLSKRLHRVGIAVRSVVGELQILRYVREDGGEAVVSSDAEVLLKELGLGAAPAGFIVDRRSPL